MVKDGQKGRERKRVERKKEAKRERDSMAIRPFCRETSSLVLFLILAGNH